MSIEERVATLERSNRRLRALLGVLVVAAAACGLLAAYGPPGPVTATKFVLVSGSQKMLTIGVNRGVPTIDAISALGTADNFGDSFVLDTYGLRVYSHSGTVLLSPAEVTLANRRGRVSLHAK